MSVYHRFKKDPEGLRALVSLWETTPKVRRERMIQVGMSEDPDYTQLALQYMLTFEDVLNLPDMELGEVLAKAHPRSIAYSIHRQPDEVKSRFLANSPPRRSGEIRDHLDEENVDLIVIGGAQLKLIEITRSLEKAGYVTTKKIPLQNSG